MQATELPEYYISKSMFSVDAHSLLCVGEKGTVTKVSLSIRLIYTLPRGHLEATRGIQSIFKQCQY